MRGSKRSLDSALVQRDTSANNPAKSFLSSGKAGKK